MNQTAKQPRYIMVGGFLGSGKTTALLKLARRLTDKGARVGLISNDQSSGLVDTQMMRSHGFNVEEIPGGCFCCKFHSLVEASERLTEASAPDYFLAEPVGSCTDLVASVSYPLRRIYGENYTIAPLSVLVDPYRARRVLGLDNSRNFSSKVVYVYRKQLEEAEYIVINKCDSIEPAELEELKAALQNEFQPREVLSVSARDGNGLEDWFGRVESEEGWSREAMEVDYNIYAEGEALLGWLNATVDLSAAEEFDGNQYVEDLAADIHQRLNGLSVEVAHLKMTLTPNVGLGDIATVNLVRNDFVPEIAERLQDPLQRGSLVINLRAESQSDALRQVTEDALAAHSQANVVSATVEHIENFQPGRPCPTHRMTTPQ